MERKIIQVTLVSMGSQARMVALCNDGTLWVNNPEGWGLLEGVPQPNFYLVPDQGDYA